MAVDSLSEKGRPHLTVEENVAKAVCEAYDLDVQKSNDPNYPIDRVFHHSVQRIADGEGTAQEKARRILHPPPSSIVEIKQRAGSPMVNYQPGGAFYPDGLIITAAKIDRGIRLSELYRVPFIVIAVLEPFAHQPEVAGWAVTEIKDRGEATVPFPRLQRHITGQETVNGGIKRELCDLLPCDHMKELTKVTEAYRRIVDQTVSCNAA